MMGKCVIIGAQIKEQDINVHYQVMEVSIAVTNSCKDKKMLS